MNVFIKKNIVRFVLTIFFVTTISFLLIKISPIAPAEAYARRAHIYSNSQIETLREEMGHQKDMILYNPDKIEDYAFKGVPTFFDIGSVVPKTE